MKLKIFYLFIINVLLLSCSTQNSVENKNLSKPENEKDKLSYALGAQLGNQIRLDSVDLNKDYFFLGFNTALEGDSTLLTNEELQTIMQEYSQKMSQKQQAKMEVTREKLNTMTEKLKKEDPKFLENYKNKKGVITTQSGLMYRILKEGEGKKPVDDDLVKFHLIGKFSDGSEFDNTYKSNEPIKLPVNITMPGWREAFPLMKVGSRWELVILPKLGFGDMGLPMKNIPPNAVLICEIELLSIEGKAPPQQNPMQPPGVPMPLPGNSQPQPNVR